MKTKILLSALCLPAVFAACTSEEILENNAVSQMPAGREVVELNVTAGVDSRMTMVGDKFAWEETDKIGSVLVDPTTIWTVDAGNKTIGNNRWDYKNGSFTTQGTTVEGAWMFYFPYDEAVSSSREGVKVTKSIQFQEYDPDGKKMAANDFRVSPIYFVNAAEGGASDIEVRFSSVYSYGVIDATFPQDVTVDKVLVKPLNDLNRFNDKLWVKNSLIAAQASMNYAKTLVAGKLVPETLGGAYAQMWVNDEAKPEDKVPSADKAEYALQDWTGINAYNAEDFDAITTPESTIDYILMDCGEGVATTSKKFYSRILFPANAYDFAFNVYFYTDKGVYKYTVDPFTYGGADLLFKRGINVQLHNVNKVAEIVTAGGNALAPTTIPANTPELEPYIIENKDLVNLINSVTVSTELEPKMLGTVTIDDAVAAALEANAKVISLTVDLANIDVTCGTKNISKLISNGGVTLKSGANVTFKGGSIKNLTIEEGATANLEANIGVLDAVATVKGTLNIANKVTEYRAFIDVQGGTLNIGTAVADDAPVPTIGGYLRNVESGELNVNVNFEHKSSTADAVLGLTEGTTALNVTVNGNITCTSKEIVLNATANLTNNAELAVKENYGTITNNGTLEVASNEVNAVINNYGIASVITNETANVDGIDYYGYINQLSDDAELECTTNKGIIETLYEKAEATIGTNNGEIIVKDIARVKYGTNNQKLETFSI